MLNVYLSPSPASAPYGIKRVLEAIVKHAPQNNVNIVDTVDAADVIHVHGTAFVDPGDKPLVYTSHGLYWTNYSWPVDYLRANEAMIRYMLGADEITAVSQWVTRAISRGVLRNIRTIDHGTDLINAPTGASQGYVLWNKARTDPVSDVDHMQKAAASCPDVKFVSTIGEKTGNVSIVGVQPHEAMIELVRNAGVYLVTARETFGIGTLEALALGVPVVGWDFGGQSEIVLQGATGLLVPFGDYNALADAIRFVLKNRDHFSKNARTDAASRWGWESRVTQYADAYQAAYDQKHSNSPRTSVIVTSYNLGRYLFDALQSVADQTDQDWECIIVDDDSSDNTEEIALQFANNDPRFRYAKNTHNLGLSESRNAGIGLATGRYVIALDADDMLAPDALKVLADSLDKTRNAAIVYGHLRTMNDGGVLADNLNDWPFEEFSWLSQMAHLNQLPYCSMVRRRAIIEAGKYRRRDWRAEDASLWSRMTSFGHFALKVTQDATLYYRFRGDSKSANERAEGHTDGNWLGWLPWSIASDTQQGVKRLNQGVLPDRKLTPFGAQYLHPEGFLPVDHRQNPTVSVIIPVGPNHQAYVVDAIDSVQAQTFPNWECIVVNDTGAPLDVYAKWAKVVEYHGHSIAGARNAGLNAATAPLVLFLDADDYLVPDALNVLIKEYTDSGHYSYGDWFAVKEEKWDLKASKPYSQLAWGSDGLHPITCLIPRSWVVDVGGFDESLPGWEDWELFIKLAINGYCGSYTNKPTLVYRLHAGERREDSLIKAQNTLPILNERYADFFTGKKEIKMCCGDSGPAGAAILKAKTDYATYGGTQTMLLDDTIPSGESRVEYVGQRKGSITIKSIGGESLDKVYILGDSPLRRYANATAHDTRLLVQAGLVRVVQRSDVYEIEQAQVPVLAQAETVVKETKVKPRDGDGYDYELPPLQESLDEADNAMSILPELIAMPVKDLTAKLDELPADVLPILLNMEINGRNRKTAVSAIKEKMGLTDE